ncbi:hypothetical protein LWE61_14265 [Sphingobium sufflavum]|uniref:hypothetical protein n=1 Tax=Sphingobium sufflavum TaxID=1129547 RepID=UPI001F42DF65|nr:hypothetical protein [Sphingobium sufflavum]MCE7797711.1 hypothetical protein [Sphingobium sufflavum]
MNARAIFPATKMKAYRLARRNDAIKPSSPRPMRRDCHGRLLTALVEMAGPGSETIDSHITGWASATFVGARHGVTLVIRGDNVEVRAAALRQSLPDAEFALAGHIVADLSVDHCSADDDVWLLTLSILTIEAW